MQGWRRRGWVLPLAALALGLASAVPAASAAPAAGRDVDDACAVVPRSTFEDRPEGPFGVAVDCLVGYGVASGTAPGTFAPEATVTRGQLATVLDRLGSVAGLATTSTDRDAFDDDDGDVHEPAIDRLADAGVLGGFADGTFRPGAPVTRGQAASALVARLEQVVGEPLPAGPAAFDDDDGTTHERALDRLAALAIVTGTDDRTAAPGAPVARGQLALLTARALDWLTEARGAALGRLAVLDATEGPELLGASLAFDGADATVALTFDEPVGAAAPVVRGFRVVGYDGRTTAATAVTRRTGDRTVLLATFPAAAARQATVATVAPAAVDDRTGTPTPGGAAPLQPVALLPGTTDGPDLFAVTRLGDGTASFGFDEPAHVARAGGFHLVLADGRVLDGAATTGGDGTTRVDVSFPDLRDADVTRVARAHVDRGTVGDAPQRPSAPGAPEVVEGTPATRQAVAVGGVGDLAGVPDLVAVAVERGADLARYTFDEAVVLAETGLAPADRFRLADLAGREIGSASASVAPDGRTVTVSFEPGELSSTTTGGSVGVGVVAAAAGGRTNQVDEEGIALRFGAGETAGPDLLRTGRVRSGTLRRAVWTFDQVPTISAAGGFSVVDRRGAQTTLAGCTVEGATVACSADAAGQPELAAAIDAAVVATVAEGAVADAADGRPGHAGGAAL